MDHKRDRLGWVDAILGVDGCIYWPPAYACRILKYDPHTNQTSLVGDDFDIEQHKWWGGCLASDGVIYCFPFRPNAERNLAIDPWKEHTLSSQKNMEEHPECLGLLFHPSNDMPNETNFDRAVTKFGHNKVMERCLPPADQVCVISNLYPFMIAASYEESDISVVFYLLRQAPSFVNCI